jgi:putative ABC transport system permease protein
LGPAQVGQHQIEVVGSFELGTDVEADGNLIVSDLTFQKIANKKLDMVEMAVLRLDRNANPDTVLVALRAALPTDVVPMTKEQLIARDLDYWGSRTPLSIMLLVGMALGFSVGVVICYQILYTDVIDHLKEFATAKAMGYADSYIRGVVITEALVLGLLGIGPSLLLGAGLQRLLGLLTGLPVRFSWGSALLVLLLSLGMCTLSGLIAMRKVQELDPAELF